MADDTPTAGPPAELVRPGEPVKKIVEGRKFTEGPAWCEEENGFLVFSDIPADTVHRWSEGKGLSDFRHPSNQTNGNAFDRQGRLISCEHGGRRVVRRERDGSQTVIADRFENKRLNSPNDVVVKSDGTIWFTDPTYGIKPRDQEQARKNVFRVDADGSVHAVADDFDQPNGLCFSPDEKLLYVADSGKGHHIRRFHVGAGNVLSGGAVWAEIQPGVPDGIRCDEAGRVWSSAGDGIHIFNASGGLLGKIPVAETPANLCFGGPDWQTLFITARSGVYQVHTQVKGAR